MGFMALEWRHLLHCYKHKGLSQQGSPKQWLQQILLELWDTAWDLWHCRNGVAHSNDISLEKEKVIQEVTEEWSREVGIFYL